MQSKIIRWGSVGIIIKSLESSPGRLNLPFTEEELLKDLDANGAHADEFIDFSLTSEWEN